ncbi:zinc finger-like protein, putative [Rhizoctonia solani AG-3 Rhs1AP]|uniref:Zinc finger-like protein, putative n=2 Tax=Rhizoctonia solani AG-3 TaxID=1086053 RepID=X8JSG2_9AGAM|nr:zinc finger-like protein, putative [Rhizoctonia solani AG-3 Rhs1AP]KEP54103.1 putative zinc finger-like protein [Rhizoctonia solani 123E]
MQGAFPTTRKAYPTSTPLGHLAFPLPVDHVQSPLSHAVKPKYKCEQCGSDEWRSSSALARHEQSHRAGNDKPHPCKECGKSFSQKTALTTHMNIHTGRRPHLCRKGCPQTFSDPSSRTRHEKEIHNPGFGFRCTRPGCNESCKRKLAFQSHMENVHGWTRGIKLPDSVYTAAKNRCAEDYAENAKKEKAKKGEKVEDESDMFNDDEWDEVNPVFNGKRPRSASTSDDHLELPPAKKQAFDASTARRNAVGSIEIPTPHPFTHPHAGHERSDSDDCSTSTASSYVDTFSGAYNPTGHAFTSGSPSNRPLNSDHDYRTAMSRVLSPAAQPLSVPPMQGSMHPGVGGYGVVPRGVLPCAPASIQHPLPCYPNPTDSHWTHGSPYDWSTVSQVAQTPHGVSPARMTHGDPSTHGIFNPSRSGLLHGVSNSGIHLCGGEHQAEHTSGSPSLDPRLVQPTGAFEDHQGLTRTPSEHSNSSHSDSHITTHLYQLEHQSYLAYPQQQVPRSVPGGDDQERSYN